MRFIADVNQLGFFYESGTYAVASGANNWFGLVQTHDTDENVNVFNTRYLGNNSRDVGQFNDGPLDYGGTVTFFPQDWKMLFFAAGSNADTWAGSPTGPKTHTMVFVNSDDQSNIISGTQNPFVSFGMEDFWKGVSATTNARRTIKGANVNTFTISASQGERVNCEVNYIAQSSKFNPSGATAITGSTPNQQTSLRPYIFSDMQLHIPSGTKFDELKSMSFEINNNLEAPHYLNGSRVIAPPIPLNREFTLTATFDATSEHQVALWDQYFQGGSTFNSILDLTIVTGSRDLIFTMSGCKLTDMSAPSPSEGTDEIEVTIMPQKVTAVARDDFLKYNPW